MIRFNVDFILLFIFERYILSIKGETISPSFRTLKRPLQGAFSFLQLQRKGEHLFNVMVKKVLTFP